MAEEEKHEETEPLLEPEDQSIVDKKGSEVPLFAVPPPPAYEPPVKPVVLPVKCEDVSIPLPTYDQSEKYEKEGVLELGDGDNTRRLDGSIRIFTRPVDQQVGSWGEFIIFFVVCLLFSWVGYIFACCLAVTVAAQSGAAAGLGMSLIIKTILVEFQPAYLTHMVHNICGSSSEYYYEGSEYSDSCYSRSYNFLRLMFWIMGFLGLFLFARGLSVFFQTRRNSNTSRT